MIDTLEDIKAIQSAYLPLIEESRIRMAYETGKVCFELMQSINKNGLMGIEELLELCVDETGLSRNTINNTALLYSKLKDWEIKGEFNFDLFVTEWYAGTGNQPTVAKIYRVILPKPQKSDRESKRTNIKKQIGKAMEQANYIHVHLMTDNTTVLTLDEAI